MEWNSYRVSKLYGVFTKANHVFTKHELARVEAFGITTTQF